MPRSAEPVDRLGLMEAVSAGAPPPTESLTGQACVLGVDDGDGFRHVQWWANGHLVHWCVDDGSLVPDLWVHRRWDLEVALLCGHATPLQLATGATYGHLPHGCGVTYPALGHRGSAGPEDGPAIWSVFWLMDYPTGPLAVSAVTTPAGSTHLSFGPVDDPDLVVEGGTTDLVRLLLGRLELPDVAARTRVTGDVLLAGAVMPAFTDQRTAGVGAEHLAVVRSVEEYLCVVPLLDHRAWQELVAGA